LAGDKQSGVFDSGLLFHNFCFVQNFDHLQLLSLTMLPDSMCAEHALVVLVDYCSTWQRPFRMLPEVIVMTRAEVSARISPHLVELMLNAERENRANRFIIPLCLDVNSDHTKLDSMRCAVRPTMYPMMLKDANQISVMK
jgi:hypothetical protein